ncbi:MAG: hypothetical protein IPP08_01755 [Chlorobiota bacterium]|jgi:hypothetical protein|nr:hypothetical protein [Chlorobiota bacterium]QQS66924.1 MAG: hypothetical protein IPP08_01755 [Chlorobiota bacterium]
MISKKLLCISILVTTTIILGCGSSNKIVDVSKLSVDRNIEITGPQFNISFNDSNDFQLIVSMGGGGSSNSPSLKALSSIKDIVFNIYDKNNKLIKQLITDNITKSGIQNSETGNTSLMGSAGVEFPKYNITDSFIPFYAEAYFRTNDGALMRKATFPMLKLSGKSISINITGKPAFEEFHFDVKLLRNFEETHGEFLSTSELYRLEIFDSTNSKVYSTFEDRFFAPIFNNVEPIKVGEKKFLAFDIKMKHYKTGKKLPDGNYRVEFTIPCKPEPYIFKQIMLLTTLK